MSTAKYIIKHGIEMAQQVLTAYVSDLTDAELMMRPAPGANHVAWQLGHLVASDHGMLAAAGCPVPDLPDGFVETYTKETAGVDDPGRFHTKAEYMDLLATRCAAALEALDAASDEDLDQPAPESMREYAPTMGTLFNLIGMHTFMHGAQFVVLRRKLGKPVLF
jgi:hypothetical protein